MSGENMEDREENNDEINLSDYIDVLKKHKWLISIIVFVSVLATGIISFNHNASSIINSFVTHVN
jgi:uncharacterized protein involved in exopolysaccharide biosynthesis